ncbi:MAG TPA: GNAT family N-acetyltransferase [Thermoanaerobaculia bacterium]|nr:GNAT family N-acetyltransferase [Thermoanaerobaculia bacterium]
MIRISTDRTQLDLELIHRWLSGESYWATGIPRERLERAIANSFCFGAFDGDAQVGFARVITDYATFAYIADVFVIESHRGRSVSKQIMEAIRTHPELQGLRRWHLSTRDAHGLYAQYGFVPLGSPERHMEILAKNPYCTLTVASTLSVKQPCDDVTRTK